MNSSNRQPVLVWRRSLLWVLPATRLICAAMAAEAADAPVSSTSTNLLLFDRFGRTVLVPTNEVPAALRPPPALGLGQQVPSPPKGASQPPEVQERIAESKTGRVWFPATPPAMMPYLANLDEYGNTAIQPGPVFSIEPLSQFAQSTKYDLSQIGLRYSFYQSIGLVSMTDVAQGASALQYYTATFFGKWALSEVTDQGRANWVSTEVNAQVGLSSASRTQTPQGNLQTIVNPNATVFGPNGAWLSELAFQQSLAEGKVVVLAGMVDQSNYLDANTYANNSQGQFMNSAFVNSVVLPFSFNNLGLNLQWQPIKSWYAMVGTGANNQLPGNSPFANLSSDNWSYLLEIGFTPKDVLGLGPGTYRLQPFLATVQGTTGEGIGLNLEQQLGTNSPFAWFGRFGVGDSQVTLDGAAAQVATGLAIQAPLKNAGLLPKRSNDYLGAALVWSQPSAAVKPTAHTDEYGLEVTYVLQLSPLTSLQPDLQYIWDPVNNPNADHNLVFQLQLNLTW
jgi:porin